MNNDDTRTGLRLLELETGIAENIDDANSAELVDYESSRIAGRAARLAMLVKGQDVIEDERRLMKIVAHELGISPSEYKEVKRFLQQADLLAERTTRLGKPILVEKVERLDHAGNYRRVGEVWRATERTEKEQALIETLDTIVQTPAPLSELQALQGLEKADRDAVLEVGASAAVVDVLPEQELYFSPLLWDEPEEASEVPEPVRRDQICPSSS